MKRAFKKSAAKKKPVAQRRVAAGAGILILVAGVVVVALFGYRTIINANREHRIREIYAGLQLPDTYRLETSDIFGDKRPYDYDAGRSWSSSQTYQVGTRVDETVSLVRAKIEHEGFRFIGEPYPGSYYTQLHFESPAHEFIRLTVSSKPFDDTVRNAALLGTDYMPPTNLDRNAAPSNVLIKVNLDDNNE